MSGIEVAGLILGAVPVLISALESYQKLGKRIDTFRKKSLHIGRMVRALSSQQRLIQSDVEIVLRNAEASEIDFTKVSGIADSLKSSLLRKEVQEEVKIFLGSNYDEYIAVLVECEHILLNIAQNITSFAKGGSAPKSTLADLTMAGRCVQGSQDGFWKRIRFTMGRESLEQAIKELDETSMRLSRLSQQSSQVRQIELVNPSSKTRSAVTSMRKFQVRARALHGAFAKSWQSQCHSKHNVRLHLHPHLIKSSSKNMSKGASNEDDAAFFCVTLVGGDGQHPSFQYTCNVNLLDDDDKENAPETGRGRKVTFQPGLSAPPERSKAKVQNICHTVGQCQAQSGVICLYLSDDGSLHYCNLPAGSAMAANRHSAVTSVISLRQLMLSSTIRFSLKQRMRMAAILSSSIMQLYSTPWWSPGLRKDSIFLPYDGSNTVDFHRPFVSCHFVSNQSPYSASSPGSFSTKGELELLQLGILIIELWSNDTIEDFARKANLTLDDSYDTRQSIARKWLASLEEDLVSSVYNSAVRCINCRFDAAVIDLEGDVKLNQSIFELVVKPLWESCEH